MADRRAANESTNASTTGLLDARSGAWAREVIERLGLPAAPFAGDPVEPGTHARRPRSTTTRASAACRCTSSPRTTPPPRSSPRRWPTRRRVLSSGTWSLLGLELDAPRLDERAAGFNLTNERGVDGTIRLLRNVMGLWLLQECRRSGASRATTSCTRLAEEAPADVPLFDPDDDASSRPATCRRGSRAPAPRPGAAASRGEMVRSILASLACRYRLVLEQLEQATGRASTAST